MMMMSLRAPAAARWSKQRSVTAVWELKRRLPWHCRRTYAAAAQHVSQFVTGSHITHYILPKKKDLPLPPSFSIHYKWSDQSFIDHKLFF